MVEQLHGLTEQSTEQSAEGGPAPGPPSTWAETEPMAASFGADDGKESKSRINSTIAMLLLAVVVAAAALWVMRQTGASQVNQKPDQAELRIERTLAQYAGTAGNGAGNNDAMPSTQAVLSRFQDDPRSRQVELAYLAKNPFLPYGQTEAEQSKQAAEPTDQEKARAERAEAMRREFRSLTLQSVMNGATPIAVISGEVVRLGDRIGSFVVASIEPRSVLLSTESNNYRLTMEGPDMTRGRGD